MKKKLKQILILALIVLIILIAYFCFKAFTVEKQRIDIKYSSSVSTESPLEAIVKVIDQNGNTKKSNLSLQLLDNNNKKVKGVKGKYHVNEGEEANCSFVIPEDLESGNYNLRIKARSGLITAKKEVSINISSSNNSDTIISLDKGIYKPGDTIKYRALLIKKSDSTPKDSDDVLVEILDGNGNRVYSENSTTTEFGIVAGKFTLASEVNSGTYTISVSSDSKKVSKTFTVNPYVTPKFEVKIDTDKDVYQVGETANITLNAKYFFGEPVANANVTGKIGKTEIAGLTDESGNFTYSYEMESTGEREIEVSVTDNSNYLIEANKTIYAQKYAFEVETIFENGMINKNIDNDVYLFAKKIDGTPVKVHATVTIDNITRQVITDENGIGKFTLTSYDTAGFYSNIDYKIVAEDNEGNKYVYDDEIEVVTNSVAIKTDKIKYNQGEDIKIDLNSITDSANRTILVCKNGEIKKILSTNLGTATVNLGDLSGIVDIFVEGKSKNNNYSYYEDYWDVEYIPTSNYSNYVRKTIFIKPSKALNIEVSTDKEEYKPGENLNLSFKVQDEGKQNVDANLLVSILDEAVLSLANNDLSIDNIRLALDDIELTDEISAADLYADILDNKSESRLMLALLRNNSSNPNLKENSNLDKYSEDYNGIILALGCAFLVILFIYFSLSTSKKFKLILTDLINCLVIVILLASILWNYSNFDELYASIIAAVFITFIVYCLFLYKFREKIFSLIQDLIVMPGIYILFLMLLLYIFNDYALYIIGDIIGIGVLIIPVIMTILIVISRIKKLNKFWEFIKNYTITVTLALISMVLAVLITELTFDDPILLIICEVLIYSLFKRIYKSKGLKKKIKINSVVVKDIGLLVVAIVISVIIILVFLAVISGRNGVLYDASLSSRSNTLGYDLNQFDSVSPASSNNRREAWNDVAQFDSQEDSIDYSGTSKGSLSTSSGLLDKFSNKSNSSVQTADEQISDTNYEENEMIEEVENNTNNETTTKVRNVFLESLAFIPNLVVENGVGSTEIKLSDNITTWNIQVVGNTKNGNIGSSSKSFKVFKEFFVDFSLPSNSVVTDKTSIPVTIYNYKDTDLNVSLNVVQNDWSTIGNYTQNVVVTAGSTKLVYIPIEITKAGNNVLRVECKAEGVSDIVERSFTVTPNGYKKSKVVSSSTIDKSFTTDYFSTEEAIENTRKLIMKIYPSAISQAVEGMESIFRMPTGCFEQTSSSLYPNILALKYLEDNNLDNEEIREKALEYISSGYQRLLTFEVPGVKGGYSLFGNAPAEPVITAFGLMELKDALEVYSIDEQVLENMKNYLYDEQKIDGSFNIHSALETGMDSTSSLAMNSYIIWALSEVDPNDTRIQKSVEYLESNINDAKDNYTLALMANVFTNVKSKKTDSIINKLMENVQENGENAYINSNIRDYYGTYGSYQAIQTTALTSMALSKNNSHSTTNNSLVKYIIANKDSYGNWGTTQSTILSLKAINMASSKGKIAEQTISVSIDGNTKDVKVGKNPLDIYELEFENVADENNISINMKKGSITYELIEEYYVPYETLSQNKEEYGIEISENINKQVKVNDIISQEITVKNNSGDDIANLLVAINIPQGCIVDQNYLEELKISGIIEKYEYNYTTLNLYIRNFQEGESDTLEIHYRANYPEEITGGTIRAFDYYNPNVEGIEMPVKIRVTE